MSGQGGYTSRQAAYDLRKLRGKGLAVKRARTRRYHIPPDAARTVAALLALRDHVLAPVIAGTRRPRRGRKPAHWTATGQDYKTLRIGMQALFHDLGIATLVAGPDGFQSQAMRPPRPRWCLESLICRQQAAGSMSVSARLGHPRCPGPLDRGTGG